MTLLRRLCSQNNVTAFNQVRSLPFLRKVTVTLTFDKTIHTKKNDLDHLMNNENVIDSTKDLESLSKEIIDDDAFNMELLSPQVNMTSRKNSFWTKLELKVLDNLVEKHGQDWDFISQHMFDKTPQECKDRYQEITNNRSNFNNPLEEYSTFTNDEINKLNTLIQQNGRKWRKIASYFPGKTALEIESFVVHNPEKFPLLSDNIYTPTIKRCKGIAWTEDELKFLNKLILKYGRNYDAISDELPGRTPKAIERTISKHMLELPALHSGKVSDWFRSTTVWSESEIRLLNELVEIHGFNWEKISEYLPGRSPVSCSAKFYGIWATWNNKVTALVPHKWPTEVLQFFNLLKEKYGKWQIIPVLVPGLTPANWLSPFCPQSRVWTKSERLILQQLVQAFGYDWEKISQYFPHRQRWSIIREVLGNIEDYESCHKDENDQIKKLVNQKKRKRRSSHWPYNEIRQLYILKEKHSSDWYKVSDELPGRTPAACYLKDFVLTNACKEMDNKMSILEMCRLQDLLGKYGDDWERITQEIEKWDSNEIKNIVNEYPKIFPPVLFGSQIKYTKEWSEKEKELFKNLIITHGNNWKFIKNFFPKKSYNQIFEYYHSNRDLFPEEYPLKSNYWVFHRATWKKQENELLKHLLKKHGYNFDHISQYFTLYCCHKPG